MLNAHISELLLKYFLFCASLIKGMVGTLYIDLYTCIFTLSLIKINCLSVLLEVKHYMERKIKV